MNNQSPLIPSGSLLEQRNKGRTRVKIAVFLVLAIHGVGLMALLMQGCNKKEDATANTAAAASDATNTPAPAFVEPTNTPAPATNLMTPPTNAAVTPPPVEPVQPPVTTPPAGAATDYVIVKGDTFATVAKKFHVGVKALLDANPSVEPTKLKIGQTIHIPAAPTAVSAATVGSAGGSSADTGGSGQTYSVKSGDTLTKIAGEFGVSVKALRSANNLKTDKIVVGQKLKIPAKTSSQPAGSTSTPSAPASGSQ
ncbi:MAG TPA: LysM peptidoglycan-binding domain-containing protein [Verrucomicrobiae bacterium]|nr:LysM peptidoglycan-binding domain-containing protein [Verrucomicrobiae bacterium]